MRILHALHSFPPESHGGIETYVEMLARAQQDRGHDVCVLAGSDRSAATTARDERHDSLPVTRLRADWQLPPPLVPVPAAVREQLDRALDPARADVLHVHHWHNLTGDLVRTARRRGLAVVVTLHDLYPTCPLFFRVPEPGVLCPPDLPRAACVRCLGARIDLPTERIDLGLREREREFASELAAAHAVLVLSAPQRDLLARIPWLADQPLRIVPLPPPHVPTPTVDWQPRRGELRLVSWGGLVPGKGLHVALAACEQLPFAGQIVLDHFGRVLDEAYAAELHRMARRVRFTLRGPYGPRELASTFPAYDAMVFPSLYLETHGFVVDEALALGLPVLVGDRGAARERIGARGRVFATGDADSLAAVLATLHADPASLRAMRAAAPPPRPTLAEHAAAITALHAAALAQR